ncbi:MAG: hypothetical protein WCB99_01210 [Candidatus Cybelea sp.]
MRVSDFGRFALSTCVAAAMLAACGGGSQPPISVPGAMPLGQTPSQARHMLLPSQQYLYVAVPGAVDVLKYPAGVPIESIAAWGPMCVNSRNGEIYISNGTSLEKYAAGGTRPVASVFFKVGTSSVGCAVDPTTGDVALVLSVAQSRKLDTYVAVYSSLSRHPKKYTDPSINNLYYLGYNPSGDLFVDGLRPGGGFGFDELPKGSKRFTSISLSLQIDPGAVQWDGSYMTIEDPRPIEIYRIAITGSSGSVVGTTKLRNQTKTKNVPYAWTWIQGDTVIAGQGKGNHNVAYWNYPAGGKPYHVLKGVSPGKHGFVDYLIVTTAN